MADQTKNLEKNTSKNPSALPTADALRASKICGDGVRAAISSLFDAGTFVETNAYTQRRFNELSPENEGEGVVTGYGAINGELVFAFIQDASKKSGAIDARHAEKICKLYELALSNSAPIIGVFASAGANVFEGVEALAGYAKIAKAINAASGTVPQIAIVSGLCTGTLAALASMFDFTVKVDGASLYVISPSLVGEDKTQDSVISYNAKTIEDAASFAHNVLAIFPANSEMGVSADECTDDVNRALGEVMLSGDAHTTISLISDNGAYVETNKEYAPALVTAIAKIGGTPCGIVATSSLENGGKLTPAMAKKAAKFVSLLDSFKLPIVTLVDSDGLASVTGTGDEIFSADLARLATAYASSSSPKVTAITGHAIGAAFALLGSKAIGADFAFALDTAEISALTADASVAFVWNDKITTDKSRQELEDEWRASLASPVAAAACGAIDDIVSVSDLRAKICSALYMLAFKGTSTRRHAVLPL